MPAARSSAFFKALNGIAAGEGVVVVDDEAGHGWPRGTGEMAARIRAFPFAETPLGPIRDWPAALRTALDMVLAMPGPATILWGPAQIQLYNDAYVAIAGDRHPATLGRPARLNWPDAFRDVVQPLLARTAAGEGVLLSGFPVQLRSSGGAVEERVFDTSFSPIRDETGRVAGTLQTLTEVTGGTRAQRILEAERERQAFLLRFSDALRPLTDPAAMHGEASRLVAEHLGTDRAYYVAVDEAAGLATVERDYVRNGAPSLAGTHRAADFAWSVAILKRGETFAVADTQSSLLVPLAEREPCAALGIRGCMGAPLLRAGRLAGAFCVTTRHPRDWTHAEAELLRDVAERVGAAEERARAEAMLHEAVERFQALVTAGTYSIYRMSADWRFMFQLDSETLANTAGPIEDWVEKYIPDTDLPRVSAAIAAAIASKSLFELEHRVRLANGSIGWVLSRAVPLLDAAGEIREWFGAGSDVTERRVATEKLRASEATRRTELEREVGERTRELKASRDLFQATLDSSMDMIQVFEAVRDTSGEIVDFRWILNNHTSEELYGDVLGHSLLTDNPGVRAEGIFEAFKRVVEFGRPDQSERHYVHEQFDGWFLQSAVKLGDSVATTTKDITAWKAAQAELLRLRDEKSAEDLRISEERLRGFGEASTDVLWIRDAETLHWTYLTPAFETIYGLARAEALAGDDLRNWLELVVPEDRERALANIRRVQGGENVTFEYRIRRPSDGQIRWLRNTDFPIRDRDGRIRAIGGVGHDASGEKEADRIIRASRRQLRTLVEGMAQLVWRAVDCGEWTWASPQWTAFTGQSSEASTGRGWLAALHPDDRERAMAAWAETERAEKPLEVEYRIRQVGTGTYRWFQTRAVPVRDEDTGEIVEWLGTSTDIDDLRQLQEEQAVMVAELQHRTRNLIGVIGSVARSIAASSASLADFRPRFTERLETLSRVQGLLSRAGEDRITIREVLEMELRALGQGTPGQDTLGTRAHLEGPDVPLRKSVVQTLTLALHELATNARKYGALADGTGELTVRWRTYRATGDVRRLFFEWTEEGVDTGFSDGEATVRGGGYGRQLIEKSLPYSLKASTTYELGANGLRCTIDMPLEKPRPRSER